MSDKKFKLRDTAERRLRAGDICLFTFDERFTGLHVDEICVETSKADFLEGLELYTTKTGPSAKHNYCYILKRASKSKGIWNWKDLGDGSERSFEVYAYDKSSIYVETKKEAKAICKTLNKLEAKKQ